MPNETTCVGRVLNTALLFLMLCWPLRTRNIHCRKDRPNESRLGAWLRLHAYRRIVAGLYERARKKKREFAARRLKQWALTFRGGRFWCCLAPKVWLPQTLWVMMTVQSCPSVPWSLFTSKFCSLELRQDGVQDHRWRRSVVFCDKLSRQCFCCWSVTGWLSYIYCSHATLDNVWQGTSGTAYALS